MRKIGQIKKIPKKFTNIIPAEQLPKLETIAN